MFSNRPYFRYFSTQSHPTNTISLDPPLRRGKNDPNPNRQFLHILARLETMPNCLIPKAERVF